jgi:hypothetical protein
MNFKYNLNDYVTNRDDENGDYIGYVTARSFDNLLVIKAYNKASILLDNKIGILLDDLKF